jgi:hypothetical protein
MSDDPDDVSQPSSTRVAVNAPSTPASAPPAPPPAAGGPTAAATVVPDGGRPPIDTRSEPARVPAAAASTSIASRETATRVPRTTPQTLPPAATGEPATSGSRITAQTPAPAAAREQAPGPLPQAPAADPSVYVTCKGFPDVCSVIRAEMARAFQRDGLVVMNDRGPAVVGVTAAVTLVSEIPSADFGTPMVTRTYSVELIGDSRGAAVAMPDPRRFSFDARFGNERLTENARLIAAGALESVRAFLSRQKP